MLGLLCTVDAGERIDQVYGFTYSSHGETNLVDEGELRQRGQLTLFMGRWRWVHINLYARQDGRQPQPRSTGITYEPGLGWLNEWRAPELSTSALWALLFKQGASLKTKRDDEKEGK